MKISLVALVDSEFAIGKNNALIAREPLDMQIFRSLTMGKAVVMGRVTYEEIGRPLPGRRNIVMSKGDVAGVECVHSLTEVLMLGIPELYVIGGESVYAKFIPIAHTCYLNVLEISMGGDKFFPSLENWRLDDSEDVKGVDLDFSRRVYVRR